MSVKSKRIIDKSLLKSLRALNCMACGKIGPSDPHHITTVKAGGGDTIDNLMPLCRVCHVELHKIGYKRMMKKWPFVMRYLEMHGRQDILERAKR